MNLALAYPVAAALAVPVPALAEGYADSYAPIFTKTVRDTETGVRARVRYFAEVAIGGVETWIDENGEAQELMWDGFTGVFEAELLDGTRLEGAAAVRFMIEAVPAVCPTVDMSVTGFETMRNAGRFLSVEGQCPAADAEARQ